ncbi:MAG: hypothetical protein S4CHLAM45_11800 [Chlamydiales bacterium]|nr:hypothetical protein [Chlamydiales bacterium]MCH9619672.1 hypothetical protein [Chlamydiales bacterium]MCH9623278.1 hypothetical protein [Chlamydiales bacterium]
MKKFVLLLLLFGCARAPTSIEPTIVAPAHPKEIQRKERCALILPQDFSRSPFADLAEEERGADWGKEYFIALHFAQDFDLYRAITGFKRALCFDPPEDRQLEIHYSTILAYFLGGKYKEVAYLAESTPLGKVDHTFPAFDDLLLILYETYSQLGQTSHAEYLLTLIEGDHAEKLTFLSAVQDANLENLFAYSGDRPYLSGMIAGYESEAKSVRKAELYNALLPGAGYWYIDQKQTAITALLVNSLFIGAATHFIFKGNIPAATITLSLEGGWYFGGIYGAGLATKEYNENLYKHYADQIGQKEGYFPSVMLNYKF